MSFTRWPLVGLGIGLCLSALCWMEVEASKIQRFAMAHSHGSTSLDDVYKRMAIESKEGLFGYEYRFLGFNVESKQDWVGVRTTEYRGLPGGRWTLYFSVLVLCCLIGCLPVLLEKGRTSAIESTKKE